MATPLLLQHHGVSVLEAAIVQAAAYADIFEFPLTAAELHRYLPGLCASSSQVLAALEDDRLKSIGLASRDGYFTLRGRERVVETRLRRAEVAVRMWPLAVRYGSFIARLPFVRMVAVTGALSVDNVEPNTDIDYLIVTEPGRLWLCRAFVVGLVRMVSRSGTEICPNYLLTERALTLTQRTFFTAHELVQMVPLSGLAVYRRMCLVNGWARHFLPNAYQQVRACANIQSFAWDEGATAGRSRFSATAVAEAVLRTRVGRWIERWEMARKIRKLGEQTRACDTRLVNQSEASWPRTKETTNGTPPELEIAFGADRCKGHFGHHAQVILDELSDRLLKLGLPLPDWTDACTDHDSEQGAGSL